MRSVCLCASACPVCVPAPPGVFLPVKRHRGSLYRYATLEGRAGGPEIAEKNQSSRTDEQYDSTYPLRTGYPRTVVSTVLLFLL